MPTSIIKVVDPYLRHVIGRDGHLDQSHVKDMGQGPTSRGGGGGKQQVSNDGFRYITDSGGPLRHGIFRAIPWKNTRRCYQHITNWRWHSKHETLTQCCFNVGPASQTPGQHWNNTGSMLRAYWGVNTLETEVVTEHSTSVPNKRQDLKQSWRLTSTWDIGPTFRTSWANELCGLGIQ